MWHVPCVWGKGNFNRSLATAQKFTTFFRLLLPPTLQENPHRLTLSMSPDEAYMEKQVKAEEEKLQRKVQSLSDTDRKEIYEKGSKNFYVLMAPKWPTCNDSSSFSLYRCSRLTLLCFSCKGLELLAAQSQAQDVSCLPALKVSDIAPTIPITPVQISSAGTPVSMSAF